jgi:lysophospholipase L1-like esterase
MKRTCGWILCSVFVLGAARADLRVHLAGDSTMAARERVSTPNPEYGWGEALPRYFRNPCAILNQAVSGRSTKSFIDEGRWKAVMDTLQPGDWVIIQFGHNDEKKDKPKLYAEARGAFAANLRRFVNDVRAGGANPVLATSVARRKWEAMGRHLMDTHGDYLAVTRGVADELQVPLLEMNRLTTELEKAHGVEGSKRLHLWIAPNIYVRQPQGWRDDTHYSAYGADRVAALAVQEIIRLQLPLAAELAGDSPMAEK